MSSFKDNLSTIFALAHQRTDAARVQLAGVLADIFLTEDKPLPLREEEQINELIDLLLKNSNPAVRARLVEKFTDVTRMPHRIAASLAFDGIELARPILLANPALTDEDLVHVVEEKGGDHALAIAARARVSEAVADALVTTGDVRVMRVVADNLGAHLSRKAIDVVSAAARYSTELREPIMRRPEMTAEAAMKLYWWVEQDLRRYALKRFGITGGQIDQALQATIGSFLGDHEHDKANDEVMQQVADWLDAHQAATTDVLPQILRMGHFRLFNILLARLTHLNLSLIDTIMAEAGGRGLAAICRAIGIDKPGFVSLFLLSRGGRPGDQIVHPRELSNALAIFDRMSPAIAKDLLHSWHVNPDYFAKHKEESLQDDRSYY